MEEIFNQKISNLSVSANSFLLPRSEYLTIINRLKQLSKDKSIKKEQKDYKQEKRYEILEMTVEGQKCRKLVKRGTQLRFVAKEDLFGTIERVHFECGHGGPRKMHAKMGDRYANVTLQQIMVYVELCERCQLKKHRCRRKSVPGKPIISNHMNSRAQVDLIDMQSEADQQFRFIMIYQDNHTKFVALKALESKGAEEVADRLIDIFCERGSPVLLQSNNGKEFVNEVINSILDKWPTTKLIQGRPMHSQSQASMKRCKEEVQKMLACWKAENKSNRWADGLRFVQWEYNSKVHNAIRQSPYEAVFGRKPGLGLNQVGLPDEVAEKVNNEEQLDEVSS